MKRAIARAVARAIVVAALLPALPEESAAAGIHLSLTATPAVVETGDTLLIEARISAPDDSFNAFDLNIAFDPARLAFVPTTPLSAQRGPLMTNACANTFHSFTTTASDVRASLSILCQNTFVAGPGVIYRIKFRALGQQGSTAITCSSGSQFYRAGVFVNPLDCAAALVTITTATAVEPTHESAGRVVAPRISVYPNPCRAGSPVEIAMSGASGEIATIDVLDLSGRIVDRVEGESLLGPRGDRVRWSAPRLAPGTYVLALRTNSGRAAFARWTLIR